MSPILFELSLDLPIAAMHNVSDHLFASLEEVACQIVPCKLLKITWLRLVSGFSEYFPRERSALVWNERCAIYPAVFFGKNPNWFAILRGPIHHILIVQDVRYHVSIPLGLFPDTSNCGLRMRGNAGNVFPATNFKKNHYLAIPACITARASHTCGVACRER